MAKHPRVAFILDDEPETIQRERERLSAMGCEVQVHKSLKQLFEDLHEIDRDKLLDF